jgi:HAD superfamily hydrolase (TIGR01509 family)
MEKRYGIYFDLDGTLVENEPLKAKAFSRAIEQLGGKADPSIYKEVMGMSGLIIRKHFALKANIEVDLDEYYDLFKSIYDNLLQKDLTIKTGVVKFLAELKSKGIEMAVISGAYESSVKYIIETLSLGQYFNLILSGDDVQKKKPDPECYLVALDKLNLPKEQVIVFEDTEAGLTAAFNAGIKSIGVRHAYNQSHDFSNAVSEFESYQKEIGKIRKTINIIFEEDVL